MENGFPIALDSLIVAGHNKGSTAESEQAEINENVTFASRDQRRIVTAEEADDAIGENEDHNRNDYHKHKIIDNGFRQSLTYPAKFFGAKVKTNHRLHAEGPTEGHKEGKDIHQIGVEDAEGGRIRAGAVSGQQVVEHDRNEGNGNLDQK